MRKTLYLLMCADCRANTETNRNWQTNKEEKCHVSCLGCNISHVMCQMSCLVCHLSHVTCHLSLTSTATAIDLPPDNSPTMKGIQVIFGGGLDF